MHCFYSDTFVLPLPDGHRFPMAKYSGLRERLLIERILTPGELEEAPQATWNQLGLDVELDDGTGAEPYLARLAHSLGVVVHGHRPEMVFYLAGADPYEGDRLGRLKLSIEGLRRRDEMVFRTCRSAGVPVVVTMSGGYAHDVDDIVTIHTNTIRTCAEARCNVSVC